MWRCVDYLLIETSNIYFSLFTLIDGFRFSFFLPEHIYKLKDALKPDILNPL